jgi:hypothetical protein
MTLRLNGSTSGYVEIDAPATAGSNTLTLPNGNGSSGQYLQTNGSGGLSWAGAGKILQVVSATKTDTQTTTSSTPVAVTGLSASITPTTNGNKVLVIVTTTLSNASASYTSYIHLYKDGSEVTGARGASAGSSTLAWSGVRVGATAEPASVSASYLDTTSGTTSITYQVYFSTETIGTAVINRTGLDPNGASNGRFASTITLMEVAA